MKKNKKNIEPRNVILEKNKLKTRDGVIEYILSKNYTCYPDLTIRWPYEFKNLYQRRVKSSETEYVCETNDRLHINIIETKFVDTEVKSYVNYTVEIVAERKGMWWTLNAYALSGNDLVVRLEEIENSLLNMFNNI